MAIKRINPGDAATPVGHYSQVNIVPPGAALHVFSGQVGTDAQGSLPPDLRSQAENTLHNIKALLESQGLGPKDVFKVNIWACETIQFQQHFYPLWDALFENDPPAMTIAYVTALGMPELKIEIEVWAAASA